MAEALTKTKIKFWFNVYEIEHHGDMEREYDYIQTAGGRVIQSEIDEEEYEAARILVEYEGRYKDFDDAYHQAVEDSC